MTETEPIPDLIDFDYHNANVDPCDVYEGPCACGAWHQPGEFSVIQGWRCGHWILFRYGKEVEWNHRAVYGCH
jgi:hypothetical protein